MCISIYTFVYFTLYVKKQFFAKIAQTYGAHHPHILYEIWNEPNQYVTWEAVIKPYAKTVKSELKIC